MSVASLWISSFLLVTMLMTVAQGRNHPDCDHTQVIRNFQRMCKSYAMWKRSTPNQFMQGQWSTNNGGGYSPYGRRTAVQPPWWWYPQSSGQQDGGVDSQTYGKSENLDPIYYEGEEVLATLERWRRNREVEEHLENFVRYQCCTNGCPFPGSYLEVEKRTNICSLR
ncbi:uncharacterized protein LOC110842283 isoform X2 [Folsomia candida]|uniref:uncharacterized protein LOC110842283 isoform X2 n=1 Tax=Folsomia candida TaxID=158441 RepID=UPI001604C63C|nr:uncharacterized protein LOC110842283 isoform X2 [Folsomia candida]